MNGKDGIVRLASLSTPGTLTTMRVLGKDNLTFVCGDINDRELVFGLFKQYRFD
jgi:dTDP-D-glucose 4,6-dehydratase